LRWRVPIATSGVRRCVTGQQARDTVDPMLALTVLGIKYPLPRDLERQAPVFDKVGCQHTHVMAPLIEVARELAYAYRSDDIRRRERKADDQNSHLGRRPGPDLNLGSPNALEYQLMAAVRAVLADLDRLETVTPVKLGDIPDGCIFVGIAADPIDDIM
jgi:hypothetical protein